MKIMVQNWIKQMQSLGVQQSQQLQIFYLDGVLFLVSNRFEEPIVDRITFKHFAKFWIPMALSMT